jgi:hypothetical protein
MQVWAEGGGKGGGGAWCMGYKAGALHALSISQTYCASGGWVNGWMGRARLIETNTLVGVKPDTTLPSCNSCAVV